jgi:hypothetical protein
VLNVRWGVASVTEALDVRLSPHGGGTQHLNWLGEQHPPTVGKLHRPDAMPATNERTRHAEDFSGLSNPYESFRHG